MMTESTKIVMIKAVRIHSYGNGVVGIELPGTPLADADHAVLDRLFPRLTQEAYRLLDQEALLSSLLTESLPEAGQVEVIECRKAATHDGKAKRPAHGKGEPYGDLASTY